MEMRLLMGLPGCGKTTYATKLMAAEPNKWYRVNWDELRKETGLVGKRFNREKEDEMQKRSFDLAERAVNAGLNLIIDNTNLNDKTRNRWREFAKKLKIEYKEIDLNISIDQCVYRDARRENPVGRAVIERMALFAGKLELYRPIVIVDVDGTLADSSRRARYLNIPCEYGPCELCHNRGFLKDHDKFFQDVVNDLPIKPIVGLVKRLIATESYHILIVSGRPIDKCGKETVEWLAKHDIKYDHILMRNSGDRRQDDIVKQEILDRLPKGKIAFILDDRKQVVNMWRRNGLTCLQVADGDF